MPNTYVGIDPGGDGAIYWYTTLGDSGEWLLADWIEAGELRYHTLTLNIRGAMAGIIGEGTAHIAVERLLPSQVSSSTSFKMGFRSGQLQALAQDANTWGPFRLYTPLPQQWQKAVCRDAGAELKKGQSKQASVAACSKLFPDLALTWGRRTKPHSGISDAACLARYAYLKAHGLA